LITNMFFHMSMFIVFSKSDYVFFSFVNFVTSLNERRGGDIHPRFHFCTKIIHNKLSAVEVKKIIN
jgi:hypothetical protein